MTTPSAGKDAEKLDLSYILLGVENGTATLENTLAAPLKLKIDLQWDPTIADNWAWFPDK